MSKEKLSILIPNAVALAMGVASVVLLILGKSQETVIPLLAIAVLSLAFVGINNMNK